MGHFVGFNVMIKNNVVQPKQFQHWWQDSLFIGAVSAAVVMHVMFLSLQFSMPQAHEAASREIAVSIRPSTENVKDADFLAQADQQGSGRFHEAHRMSSDMPAQTQDQTAGEQQLEALEKVQTVNLEASEIDIRLGTTWIEEGDIEKFIYETLGTPKYAQNSGSRYSSNEVKVHYNNFNE